MKILIVEDDAGTAEVLREGLASDSHNIELAADGADGSFMGRAFEYDAILLDYSLPKKDGLAVCKEIRTAGKLTPIIFLSATDDTETKVAAFSHGADDYVVKPFSLQELYARLRAVGRRTAAIKQATLKVHDITLDTEAHVAMRGAERMPLTRKEFSLLEYFMRNSGVVLSRALIMEHVWTADSDPFSNTVEAHIRNLRKKMNAGNRTNLIFNIPGRGYVIRTPESPDFIKI